VRRVLHRDSSFGVHGGSGKYDGDDFTTDAESSRFTTSVEEIERTERATAPGCWVRGWSAVDAEEDRLRFTGGVNGSDLFIGTGGPRVTQWEWKVLSRVFIRRSVQ